MKQVKPVYVKLIKKNSGGINSIDAVIKVAEKFPEIKEKLLSET